LKEYSNRFFIFFIFQKKKKGRT